MLKDFIFNNKSSEMYDIVCVKFDDLYSSAVGTSQTDLETQKSGHGDKFYIVKHVYSEPIKFTMQIMNRNMQKITPQQQEQIINWLCVRGVYKELHINTDGYENIIYNVIITNPKIIYFGGVVGMEFTVTADSPFGYSNQLTKSFTVTANTPINVYTSSFVDDYLYPIVEIELQQSGTLVVTNNSDSPEREFKIDNCAVGEKIVVDSYKPFMTTSVPSHHLYQDSNKKWIRLINGENLIKFSLACNVTFKYREIRKVAVS